MRHDGTSKAEQPRGADRSERTSPTGWRPPTDQGGSALVLVLLILLGLSAIGMVALSDVARSVQESGTFRARTTASTFSDAVSQFMAKRLGDKANTMLSAMKRFQEFDIQKAGGNISSRQQLMDRGAVIEMKQDPGTTNRDFGKIFNTLSGDESGLFVDNSGNYRSFESREANTEFRVVIRDPVDGVPVPGYSERYCFKKVTIAAEADVGDISSNWTEPRQVGVGRTVVEGLIGPVECGS